jgi:hypothetical protein
LIIFSPLICKKAYERHKGFQKGYLIMEKEYCYGCRQYKITTDDTGYCRSCRKQDDQYDTFADEVCQQAIEESNAKQ